MFKKIKLLNDKAALKLFAVYGSAITIWTFAIYSLLGAIVSPSTQATMLFWSNAAQLVFCPLSLYAAVLISRQQRDTHEKHEQVHEDIKAIHKHLGIK